MVAWENYGQDGSAWGIFARRFSSLSAPQGSEFQVNDRTNLHQTLPSVSADADGDFVTDTFRVEIDAAPFVV